jgi:hypothetical protein
MHPEFVAPERKLILKGKDNMFTVRVNAYS